MPPPRNPASFGMPTAIASRAAVASVVVVATDEDDLLIAIGKPGELRAEAGAQHRDAHRAGDVGVVELLIGASVDDQGPVGALLLDLSRCQREDLGALGQQRALVERDDRLEVRRLRPELGDRLLDELLLVGDREGRVVLALEADRRGDLHVHPRPAAHRAAEVPGPDLASVGKAEQLVLERAEDPAGPLALLDRQVRPGDVVDEQGVAGEHRPRLLATATIDQGEGGVLGPVARCVQGSDQKLADLELEAVVDRLVLVVGLGVAMDVDRRPGCRGQPAVAGDVVGVVVSLEDVLDRDPGVAGQLEVLVDLEARIDDRGLAGLLVADEIRGTTEIVVGDLAEDHEGTASASSISALSSRSWSRTPAQTSSQRAIRVGSAIEYSAREPSRRRLTMRSRSSTPRCLETLAWVPPVASTSSPTEISPSACIRLSSRSRVGSPRTAKRRAIRWPAQGSGQSLCASIALWLSSHMEILLAIPFGLAIGLVVGPIGGGGAILALPVLVYVLDQGVSSASTASLIVVALGASVGAGSQARDGQLCWRIALVFSLPAAVGAYAGTVANDEVSARALILAFVPVMLSAAILTFRRGDDADAEADEDPGCPRPSLIWSSAAGLVVGLMTGFFGVGGGFLIVPALTMLLGLAMRRAIATSLAIITLTGVAALVSHLAEGRSRTGHSPRSSAWPRRSAPSPAPDSAAASPPRPWLMPSGSWSPWSRCSYWSTCSGGPAAKGRRTEDQGDRDRADDHGDVEPELGSQRLGRGSPHQTVECVGDRQHIAQRFERGRHLVARCEQSA